MQHVGIVILPACNFENVPAKVVATIFTLTGQDRRQTAASFCLHGF